MAFDLNVFKWKSTPKMEERKKYITETKKTGAYLLKF